MKSNNYFCHVPYFRNSIAYDHDFWYTSVKMIISQNVFFIFSKFWFFGLLGVKMAKHGPKWQKILSVALHISGTIHRVTVIYGTHLWNDNIWRCFFILSKFVFLGPHGGEMAKNSPEWQKVLSVAFHISGTIHHMIVIYCVNM